MCYALSFDRRRFQEQENWYQNVLEILLSVCLCFVFLENLFVFKDTNCRILQPHTHTFYV